MYAKYIKQKKILQTGFMCKIPYQNQLLPVLITNNHVLNEEKIKIGQTIRFSFNVDQIEKTIKIDNSRKKIYESNKRYNYYRNKEIKKKDKIDDFLDIDDKDNIRSEDKYINERIYILKYQLDFNCSYSLGRITYIDNGNVYHTFRYR